MANFARVVCMYIHSSYTSVTKYKNLTTPLIGSDWWSNIISDKMDLRMTTWHHQHTFNHSIQCIHANIRLDVVDVPVCMVMSKLLFAWLPMESNVRLLSLANWHQAWYKDTYMLFAGGNRRRGIYLRYDAYNWCSILPKLIKSISDSSKCTLSFTSQLYIHYRVYVSLGFYLGNHATVRLLPTAIITQISLRNRWHSSVPAGV